MYKDATIQKYLNDFAAKQSTPGGGSAAALCGALGVSALLMSANFSDQKIFAEIIAELEEIKKELLELVNKDAEVYAKLREAMKAKTDLEFPAKESFGVPHAIAQLSNKALQHCQTLLDKGNKYLVSDVGCGAAFLEAAFQAAVLNCNMNLALIKDKPFVDNARKELSEIGGKLQNDCKIIRRKADCG